MNPDRQKSFHQRANDRANRMNLLVRMFQAGEISVRKFRFLAGQLKSEHRRDERESGARSFEKSLV